MKSRSVQIAHGVLVITALLAATVSAQEAVSTQESLPAPDPELPVAPIIELAPPPSATPPPNNAANIVRVPYIPEYLKQQIRDEIRNGLREDAVTAVLAQARQERWGIPDALPAWVNHIKLKGDVRVRTQADLFAKDNRPNSYIDYNAVNARGGITKAGIEAYANTTEDRYRLRVRGRVGLDATVTNDFKIGARLSTGNTTDPVSTNQTLGNYANRYTVVWDQLYLKYDDLDRDRYKWLTVMAGRIPNPWLSTDLVWDNDLAFEGLAATMRMSLRGGDSLLEQDENDRTLLFTLGAFPIQEVERSAQDKWLYGAQLGSEFITLNQSVFKIGLAYYAYDNIVGERNTPDSTTRDFTAPRFFQKGNSLFDINNSTTDPAADLFAHAADYDLINLTLSADFAMFAPIRVILIADYVENIGFDKREVESRLGVPVEEETTGAQVQLTVGWPDVAVRGNWRAHFAFRRLESDAVPSEFTDSDFHLGGTNAKGYILGFDYGLLDDTWLSMRYLSSDEVSLKADGFAPLGEDSLQVDVNVRF